MEKGDDQEEALVISDRIAMMSSGRVEQIGTPVEIYSNPQTHFVASFIGETNSLTGNVASKEGNIATIRIDGGLLINGWMQNEVERAQSVTVFIRPQNIKMQSPTPDFEAPNKLRGVVSHVTFVGNMVRYKVETTQKETLAVEAHNPLGSEVFEEWTDVTLSMEPKDVLILPSS